MTMSATMHSHREDSGRVLVIASAQITDDTLVCDSGFCGLAVKQVMPAADTPKANLRTIAVGERYLILDTGECDVVVPGGLGFTAAKGTELYILPADNTLYNAAGAGRKKLGKVRYMGPDASRDLPAGMWTVDLTARKDF